MVNGDWMLARKELSQLLIDDPAMLPAQLLLTEIAFRLQQHPSELLPHIDPVLAAQPLNKRARLLLEIARKGLGNSAEAWNELNHLIKDRAEDTEAQSELGLFDLADKEYGPVEAISRKLCQPGRTPVEALEGLVGGLMKQSGLCRSR